jgi:hypothetical protein
MTKAERQFVYACIVELSYVQSVENCGSGLCASAKGAALVEEGMKRLGIPDLHEDTWAKVLDSEKG